jgi:hypothetical protein
MPRLPELHRPSDNPQYLEELAEVIRLRYRAVINEIEIQAAERGVVLHGSAATYYGKQIAQHELLRRGFAVIANHIRVAEASRS